ncbi:MAG: Ig domain-containing protein, partial [Pirellulales bacterium]
PEAGRLQLTADLSPAQLGREWTAALRLQNWDPALGTPQLRLSEGAPDGMVIDPADSKLVWTPPEDFPLGTIDVHVAALGRNSAAAVIESDLKVEVRRPNSPPQLTIPEAVDVWLGRPWQLELSAADGDLPEETLKFSLGGSVPPGLTIDSATGLLQWSPPAEMDLGNSDVEITVTDSGQPPETDRRTLTLQLVDDNALYTYFTGTVAVSGNWEAWLYDRSTNQLTVVRTGDEFRIADVSGKAVRIDENAMDIESGGQVYRLQLGENLRSWSPTGTADAPATSGGTGGSGESSGT